MEGSHKAIISIVSIVLLIVIIVIVAGIQNVDYYNYGLLKRKSTGTINKVDVYRETRLLYGPDYTIVTFPATAINVEMKNVVGLSKNNQQVKFKISFQYLIRRNELGKLFETHKFSYHNVIVKTAIDSIKDSTSQFDVDEFVDNRRNISKSFFDTLRRNVEGVCCLQDCRNRRHGCLQGCKKETNCTDSDRGLFVEIKYFQFGDVDLNNVLKGKKLAGLILKEDEKRKYYEKRAKFVRQETERLVRKLHDETNEVFEKANSDAELIRERADARYKSTVEGAQASGLKDLYQRLRITDEKSKNSFDYLRTLQRNKHIQVSVGFQQYITGSFPPK